MSDPSADRPLPFTKSDVESLGDVVDDYYTRMGMPPSCRPFAVSRLILEHLAAAGRLLPADADRAEEWTMRYSLNGGPLQIGEEGGHVLDDLEDCQRHIRVWQQHYPDLTYSDVSYLRRDVFTGPWVDGSTE